MQPYVLFLNTQCQYTKGDFTWKTFFAYLYLIGFGVGVLWTAFKLFFLFKNISKNPFTLSHVITFCWLITSLAFFANYSLFVLKLSGQSLYYGMLVLFIPQQFLYVSVMIYGSWFAVFSYCLVTHVTFEKRRRFEIFHYGFSGTGLLVQFGFCIYLTIYSFGFIGHMASEQFLVGTILTSVLILLDSLLLLYIAILVLVSVYFVWKKYHIHPPPSIQSTKLFWIAHGVISIFTIVYVIILSISVPVPALSIVTALYTPIFILSAQTCTMMAINHSKHPFNEETNRLPTIISVDESRPLLSRE